MIHHVDDVVGPLTVGKMYWVPTVYAERYYFGVHLLWPVTGPVHTDKRFFNFDYEHQHVDFRFVGTAHFKLVGGPVVETQLGSLNAWEFMAAQPVVSRFGAIPYPYTPENRRMRCKRIEMNYPFFGTTQVCALNKAYSGTTVNRTQDGHIYCPHQQFRIDQVPPDETGIVTCPLHGLRIDLKNGKCGAPINGKA